MYRRGYFLLCEQDYARETKVRSGAVNHQQQVEDFGYHSLGTALFVDTSLPVVQEVSRQYHHTCRQIEDA